MVVFASDRVMSIRFETAAECKRWCELVRADLKRYYNDAEWKAREDAANELEHVYMRRFEAELQRYTHLMLAMVNSGPIFDFSRFRLLSAWVCVARRPGVAR